MSKRTLRPRPFDIKKKLTVVHEAAGLDLEDETVARSIANRNAELEKNNDKVVTVASKSGEEMVPVPGFRKVAVYEQLYPNDFSQTDDMNADYLTSGKNLLPMESQCVEYAADSEDEEWLEATVNAGQDRLSLANFEKLVWKLELVHSMVTQHVLRKAGASMMERKASGASAMVQPLSKSAAVKLLQKHEGVETTLVERVYEYWVRKRRVRKEPLLRTLQPRTAANDRNPDHTFREREKVKRPNTRRRRHVNRGDNVEEKLSEIKDEMGHVCNIFKSMINRESVKAHVVNVYIAQKRLLMEKLAKEEEEEQGSQLEEIRKEQTKKERYLKRDDAEYRAKICRFLLQNVFHGQLRKMFASARGTEGEGGGDAAVSRRSKKAQKRRQKVISFLVQDRNWQKWHDKTWMQKMYIMIKKRDGLRRMTKHMHQKNTWRKWKCFVKHTRDRRLRKMMEISQKRKLAPGKAAKQAKVMKPPSAKAVSDARVEYSKTTDAIRKKMTGRPHSAPHGEGREFQGELAAGDVPSAEAVAESTISWARQKGIVPPEPLNVSKTISIPSAFVVPQDGFSCLPPRLKEMYTEAEKDVMLPPKTVSRKMKSLKSRRRRIQSLLREGLADRGEAVAQFNLESRQEADGKEKGLFVKQLQQRLLQSHDQSEQHVVERLSKSLRKEHPALDEATSGTQIETEEAAEQEMNVDLGDLLHCSYPEARQAMLKFIKKKIHSLRRAVQGVEAAAELENWLERFCRLKSAKLPNACLLEQLLQEIKPQQLEQDNLSDLQLSSMELSIDAGAPLVTRKRNESTAVSRSKTTKIIHESDLDRVDASSRRVSLTKRQSRKLSLEIRLRGQNKLLPLRPGKSMELQVFEGREKQLNVDRLHDYMESVEPATPDKAQTAAAVESPEQTAVEFDQEGSKPWNAVYSMDGPVAQVPVQSHRMIKAQSAPVLVTSEGYYTAGSQLAKESRRKASGMIGTSGRLMRMRGVSLSVLKKRRRTRRRILRPLIPESNVKHSLPNTKLRKIRALTKVRTQVPSRPERKPLFCYLFKLDKPAQSDKIPANMRLPPNVSPDVVYSGNMRIGRGNRVWIDRINPQTLQPCRNLTTSESMTGFGLLPTVKRVLEMDQRKKKLIKQQSVQQTLFKRREEEERAQKLTQIQKSASQLATRQQSFLPHYITEPSSEKDEKTDDKAQVKKKDMDTRKDAQRLYGMAMELGLELPLEQLIQAAARADGTCAETDLATPRKGSNLRAAPESSKIKDEPVERTGLTREDKNHRTDKVTTI